MLPCGAALWALSVVVEVSCSALEERISLSVKGSNGSFLIEERITWKERLA